jgi:hypothetical protein
MDAFFRRSGLMRDKWDSVRYGIAKPMGSAPCVKRPGYRQISLGLTLLLQDRNIFILRFCSDQSQLQPTEMLA